MSERDRPQQRPIRSDFFVIHPGGFQDIISHMIKAIDIKKSFRYYVTKSKDGEKKWRM